MALTTKAALAAELGVTPSRVSQYVKKGLPVRTDGKLDRDQALHWIKRFQRGQSGKDKGANRAQHLAKSVAPKPQIEPLLSYRSEKPFDILIESFEDRIENWREIRIVDAAEMGDEFTSDVSDAARQFRVEPADILTWLRAGCPYLREGNWETGDGFVLRPIWLTEWSSLVWAHIERAGRYDLHRALGMVKGAWARPVAA